MIGKVIRIARQQVGADDEEAERLSQARLLFCTGNESSVCRRIYDSRGLSYEDRTSAVRRICSASKPGSIFGLLKRLIRFDYQNNINSTMNEVI